MTLPRAHTGRFKKKTNSEMSGASLNVGCQFVRIPEFSACTSPAVMRQLSVCITKRNTGCTQNNNHDLTPVFLERNILNQCRTAKIHEQASDPQLDESPGRKDCAACCGFWAAHRHPYFSISLDKNELLSWP